MPSVRFLAILPPLVLLAATRAPAAPVGAVFGGRVPCSVTAGVQFCPGGGALRVESFDGVPLDVAVTLPPADRAGPFPLIVDLHGWGGSKGTAPSATRARAGYVVLSYTARGFGQSCGSAASRVPDPSLSNPEVCAQRGWIRLADARYEARDTQHLAGLLADEGLVIPDQVGVTGVSYGGGQSMILAALRDRVMLPDGTLVPWTSPGGRSMTIAAAAPLIPWTDLAEVLTPAGRMLDYVADNAYGRRAGVQKQSWEDLLYATGAANFYAPPGADPDADLPGWHARISQGEPYDGVPLLEDALDELTSHHSGFYIDNSVAPAPLFIYNAWTDDLFPGDEAVRFWRKTRARHPGAEIAVHLADGFGHPRASIGALASLARISQRVEDHFARHLLGAAVPAAPGFETWTQGCGVAERGPFTAPDWDALRPGEVRLSDAAARTFAATGADTGIADQLDPLDGYACRTLPAADDAGAATYRFPAVAGAGWTLMGAPTVIAEIAVSGSFAQVVGRLWDVAPDGTQTLVTHGMYRPRSDNLGPQVFQLHPNGWHFAAGHLPKLELLGQSPPYGRPATGTYRVTVRDLELRLPVLEGPDGGAVATPAAHVFPPDAPEPPDAGVPECGAAPAGECAAGKGRLTWRKGKLGWQWTKTRSDKTSRDVASLLGVPEATTAYRLCVWDRSSALVTSVAIPAGGECTGKNKNEQETGPCWTAAKGGFRYLDTAGTSDGVELLALRARKRAAAFTLRAQRDGAAAGPLRVQLLNGLGGCWETSRR